MCVFVLFVWLVGCLFVRLCDGLFGLFVCSCAYSLDCLRALCIVCCMMLFCCLVFELLLVDVWCLMIDVRCSWFVVCVLVVCCCRLVVVYCIFFGGSCLRCVCVACGRLCAVGCSLFDVCCVWLVVGCV